jgi:putative two-component system response regulator
MVDSPGTTILIAEDSRVQKQILARHLELIGYNTLSASDGLEALQIYDQYQPRIVVTDLEMPEMDGFELIRRIRTHGIHYTHIMVLSSMESKDTVVKALSLGADDYLVKPFHPDELRVRLEAAERQVRVQSQERIILLMAKLTDYRSPETGYHIERVQQYTRKLGELLLADEHPELNQRLVATMTSVSSLHDIGKVAIPDEILNKPGALSDAEYDLMKTHTTTGGDILDDAYREVGSELLLLARDITRFHHERYDGGGYPDGLSAEDIPIGARIVALADVFDAISSERVYKTAFSREKCRAIIQEERGNHFDPLIAQAFLDNEDAFWTIKSTYAD